MASRLAKDVVDAPVSRIPTALQALLRGLGTRLGIDRTTIFALARDRQGFYPLASWHDHNIPDLPALELRASASDLVRRVLRGERVRIERIDDSTQLSAADVEFLRGLGHKSLLALPLRVAGGTVGAHTVGGLTRSFSWPRRLVEELAIIEDVVALSLERMRQHEEREHQEREHELTQRIAGVGHWRHNPALHTMLGSPELHRALQLDPRRELGPEQIIERIEPEDRARFEALVHALVQGNAGPAVDCRVRRHDGQIRWFRCWGEASERKPGDPLLIHGVMHDITERKLAEQQLEAAHASLVQAQEDERARLGRELHDELGQRIAALDLRLVSMSHEIQAVAPNLATALGEVIEQVQELGYLARSVSHALYPVELQRLGLSRSLRSLCQRSAAYDMVDVVLEAGPIPDTLPQATALALYRVAQAALGNTLRHANARRVALTVGCNGDRLRLTIADDGDGFTNQDGARNQGLGLTSMQERMRLVHGSLTIESSPGAGTRVCAEVPIDPSGAFS
jgi:signal transduction histidine kinase